jgi:phospholipase C
VAGVSRRTFLKGLAAGTTIGAVPELVTGPSAHGVTSGPGLGSRPFTSLPVGVDTLPQIKHLIYFMMENHSFDNYFGMLGRGDGFSLGTNGKPTNMNRFKSGKEVVAYHAPSVCTADYDIGQDWVRSHTAWDHGKNDGFLLEATRPDAMAYFDKTDIPFYYSLAASFPVCDRYFCSLMGQTDPNRRFMVAGTSLGEVNDISITGLFSTPRPPNGTIFDLLNRHGISWKDYFVDLPTSTGLFPYVAEQNSDKLAPIAEFLSDCALGTLPEVSYVDPDGWQGSEENPQDIDTGEFFSSLIINAVLNSPSWPNILLLFTYDEHGGYYDHVPPVPMTPPDNVTPQVTASESFGDHFDWSGFRVPAVIVSPWAKKNYVSHVIHDHTSFLRLIETKWNLPALTARDANASNLLDSVDFSRRAFATPPVLAPAPAPVGLPACYLEDPTLPIG